MLAVSIGDQAGNRCCLKAELSGLRAKGPGLPFTFPMRARALASEELDWQLETQKLRVNQPSSCLPVFYFSDISLHTYSHTPLLAKGFTQQALHHGGDRCVLLLINRNSLLNYLFLLLSNLPQDCVLPSYNTQTCTEQHFISSLAAGDIGVVLGPFVSVGCWMGLPGGLSKLMTSHCQSGGLSKVRVNKKKRMWL